VLLSRLRMRPVVYDVPATISGAFREIISSGALKEAIAEGQPVAALRDHEAPRLLGRVPGTMTFRDTSEALEVEVELPPTELGRETAVAVERGDLSGASFAFGDVEDEWYEPRGGDSLPTRLIRRIGRLFDVSPCTFPAYSSTSVWMAGSDLGRSGHVPKAWRDRLEELEGEISRERRLTVIELTLGRRIGRPEGAPSRKPAVRRGCVHDALGARASAAEPGLLASPRGI
jgi:HK97 family phage prohead protease